MIEIVSVQTFIVKLIFSAAAGLLTYFTFALSDNAWVRNMHHYLTFVMLPPIACAITHVISGNLALSLGMVGALSIIRFRNPVRSPLELSSYFFLITIGVVINVKVQLGFVLLIFFIILITSSSYLMSLISKIPFVKSFSNIENFSDTNVLELVFLERVKELEQHSDLIYSSQTTNADKIEFSYRVKLKRNQSLDKF